MPTLLVTSSGTALFSVQHLALSYTTEVSSRDFPLPISDDAGAVKPSSWPVEQEPSTLISLWPGVEPPTMTEIVAALAEQCDAPPALMEEMPPRPDVHWAAAFATSLLEAPLILWIEPARPLAAGELEDPRAAKCRWVVGCETMLSPQQPYEDYITVLRAVAAAFEPIAVLDPATGRWCESDELADLAHDPPGQPPVEVLWTIHAVFNQEKRSEPMWLHTHGLWRCGKPELEMLEVPVQHSGAAGSLLNDIAQLSLEHDLPAPGEIMEVGPNIAVMLQPWQLMAPQVRAPNSGGLADRGGDNNPHAGMRAVVCGDRPRGLLHKRWAWPEDVVAALGADKAVIYKSTRATQREAEMARLRWSDLATAFAAAPAWRDTAPEKQPAVFTVKAGFATDHAHLDNDDSREHMWFTIRRFVGDQAEAQLINQPMDIAAMKPGDIVHIPRDMVSDWTVFTALGRFGPPDVPALWRAIDAIKRGEHSQ